KRGKNGKLSLIPASDETRGHGTTCLAKFWKQQVRELLETPPCWSMPGPRSAMQESKAAGCRHSDVTPKAQETDDAFPSHSQRSRALRRHPARLLPGRCRAARRIFPNS